MVLVQRIRKRDANIVVEANAEVLFAATGDVGRWTNRFSQRVLAFTAQEAPANKRPRWSHYGKPLKSTFKASTTYQPGRMKVYSAVGSTARHGYYVDQGTGIYAGNGPYEAKVLPPWLPVFDLYERTWRPGGPGSRRVKPVMIKGQRGQFFMDKGLGRAFRSMRLRGFQLPGEGGPTISAAMNSAPTGMLDFLGNTPADAPFRAQLDEWRAMRDARFRDERTLGPRQAERRRRRPKVVKPKVTKPTRAPKTKPPTADQKAQIARQIAARLREQGRQFRGITVLNNGTWTALIKGTGGVFTPVTGRWRSP